MEKSTYAAMLRTLKHEVQQATRKKRANDKFNTKMKTKINVSSIYRSKV